MRDGRLPLLHQSTAQASETGLPFSASGSPRTESSGGDLRSYHPVTPEMFQERMRLQAAS